MCPHPLVTEEGLPQSEPLKSLAPIDKAGLFALADKGKADASAVRTVTCRTVLEGRFRHLNYIRTLPAHVIDEPPALLGDDTAPNPTEALLAALGSCLSVGIHANAVARGITLYKVEFELEGDINITAVWGVGDLTPKPLGLTAVRGRSSTARRGGGESRPLRGPPGARAPGEACRPGPGSPGRGAFP